VRDRVEVVPGSHNDIDVVAKAFAGADSVFWLIPPNSQADSVDGYYLEFTRPACEAIRSQGVQRVVGVSSLGRGFEGNAGHLSAAFAMDELIESAGVNYRALHLPFFMENLLNQLDAITGQGAFFLANSADRTLRTVATRDIAAAAARLLLDGSWSGTGSMPVIGPDELSPNGMAQVMSEVLERPVRYQQVTGESYKAALLQYGMSEANAQGLVDLVVAQNHGIYDTGPRAAQPAATSFRQWCEEALRPAVLRRG
jgi:uncharacterized protein YbjT (DUF2867 family)